MSCPKSFLNQSKFIHGGIKMGKRKRNSKSLSAATMAAIADAGGEESVMNQDICAIDGQHEIFEDESEYHTEVVSSNKRLRSSRIPEVNVIYAVHPSATTKYAPKLPTVKGDYELHCIGIDWNDEKGPSLGSVKSMGNYIAEKCNELSHGAMRMKPYPRTIKVNLPCKPKSLSTAERTAKRIADANGGDKRKLYAIINSGAINHSHAAGKTAHLLSGLKTTSLHETLHLVGCQHANRIAIATEAKNKGKREFQSSRDGTSVMSIYSSDKLTSSQFYDRGWYEEHQVAQHDFDSPAAAYNLQPVFADESSEYLNAVLINRGTNKSQLFLSVCQVGKDTKSWALALHTRYGSGCTRQEVFGKHAEFDGLSFDTISADNNHWQVKISPKPSI